MRWFFKSLERMKIAREIQCARERQFTQYRENVEAHTEYRKIWPKCPVFAEDDAHEAGWIQGYSFASEKLKHTVPAIWDCPYCEMEASNEAACKMYEENKQLKSENERIKDEFAGYHNFKLEEKLRDLVKRAKAFKYPCSDADCNCPWCQWVKETVEVLDERRSR